MFGDNVSNKYMTCARCRPFNKQVLDSEFFQKEHTKPVFNNNSILTVNNMYTYLVPTIPLLKYLKL